MVHTFHFATTKHSQGESTHAPITLSRTSSCTCVKILSTEKLYERVILKTSASARQKKSCLESPPLTQKHLTMTDTVRRLRPSRVPARPCANSASTKNCEPQNPLTESLGLFLLGHEVDGQDSLNQQHINNKKFNGVVSKTCATKTCWN